VKVRIDRARFAEATRRASVLLPRTAPEPTGTAVHLRADQSGLRITGFDGTAWTFAHLPAEVLQEGSTMLAGHALASIADGMSGEWIDLTEDAIGVAITCGHARYVLGALDHLGAPAFQDPPASSGHLPADVLAAAVKSVASAADPHNAVAVLAAVRIKAEGRRVRFTASDRYRLAEVVADWEPLYAGLETSVIVPVRYLVDAVKTLGRGDVTLCLPGDKQRHLGLQSLGGAVVVRAVEGPYLRTQALEDLEHEAAIELNASELRAAASRLQKLDPSGTRLYLDLAADSLTVSSPASSEVHGRERIACCMEGPDRLRLALRGRYLEEALAPVDGTVRLMAAGWRTPVLLQGTENEDYRCWVTPVADQWANPATWASERSAA
jgi:DNA polymerase-3 subunit beta